ncbi:MAG: molybdopterin-binding/glycosyltransferase family 2 protein [Rhizobiaceae bacterium]|nr:molybdopterin-binding/glycosyltransferase family 2 protein [Rhizobiaceae bacterium]
MKFGEVPIDEAAGAVLAHSVRAAEGKFPKGRRLSQDDIAALRKTGIASVIVARLSPGDLMEDEAAARLAAAVPTDHLRFSPATTGRVNVFSGVNGLFRAARDVVDRFNRVDPAITLACLEDRSDVRAGDMVATIKIIPLAVAENAVREAAAVLRNGTAFAVKPYRPRRVALVATELPSLKPSVMDKTRSILAARLSASGSTLDVERRVAHRAEAVAEALRALVAGHDMLIVFGASAVADAEDVIPAGIRGAGGGVDRVGLPVDPGNLLVLGHIGDTPVIGAPGCARSPKENGFDWVLNRILADETPTADQLTGLGVGGLLMEIPTRPLPRLGKAPSGHDLRVAAIVLAAGSASRMAGSGHHKLLARFDGVPLVRRSVATALASQADRTVVVTGYRANDIGEAIDGLAVEIVHNPDFTAGMASSLVAGLAAVREGADAVLVMLADMPGIRSEHIDRMIEAFRREGGAAIVRATSAGKRGNPVILPASTFDALSRLTGDIGARPVIERSGLAVVDVDIGEAAHVDADTPEAIVAAGGELAG